MKPADRAPGEGAPKPTGAKGDGRKAKPRCPICDKPVSEAYQPFCSKRCADVDLSRWLGGVYAIPGSAAGEDEDQDD